MRSFVTQQSSQRFVVFLQRNRLWRRGIGNLFIHRLVHFAAADVSLPRYVDSMVSALLFGDDAVAPARPAHGSMLPGGGTKLVTAPEGVKAGETIKVTVKVPVD